MKFRTIPAIALALLVLLTFASCAAPASHPSAPPSASPSAAPTVSPSITPPTPSVGSPSPDTGFSKPGVYPLQAGNPYNVDLSGGNAPEDLTISGSTDSPNASVEYGGDKAQLAYSYVSYAAIMRANDGALALFISTNGDDNAADTAIYMAKDGALQKTDEIGFGIDSLSLDSMDVSTYIYYFLGNQILYATLGLTDDFTVVMPDDGFFGVVARTAAEDSNQYLYTAKVGLDAKQLVNGEYVDAVMPAGTQITPVKMTLDLTQAIVEGSDGSTWLLEADRTPDEWGNTIFPNYKLPDGTLLPEAQVFDGCTYAGP